MTHDTKIKDLHKRVLEALQDEGITKHSAKSVEIKENRVEVRTSKKANRRIEEAIEGWGIVGFSTSDHLVIVPISFNKDTFLTLVKAGKEEIIEVGSVGCARIILEKRIAESSRVEWNDRMDGELVPKSLSYKWVDGRWRKA